MREGGGGGVLFGKPIWKTCRKSITHQRTRLRMPSLSDIKRQRVTIFQIQASMNREDVPLAATSVNWTTLQAKV